MLLLEDFYPGLKMTVQILVLITTLKLIIIEILVLIVVMKSQINMNIIIYALIHVLKILIQ